MKRAAAKAPGKLESDVRRLRRQVARRDEKIKVLEEENRLLKLQLQEYRDKIFKKNKGKDGETKEKPAPKKRGAPKGHPGTTRKKPDRVDEHVDVRLKRCPDCGGGHLSACQRFEDHYQEDIVIPRAKVTRFRHHFYWCKDCKQVVHGVGQGELPGSYIGPVAKSVASYLHFQLKIPYRPLRRLFRDLLGLSFVPSSAPGFDRQIRIRGDPLYEKLKSTLRTERFTHIDETGWRNEGVNHWLWCFAAMGAVVYLIDRSRGSKVVTSVLGKKYGGVIISDFLAAYNRIQSRKQRCLVHLLRLIKKWQLHFREDQKRLRYFTELKALIKGVLALSKQMADQRPENFTVLKADLVARLRRALSRNLAHTKADKFRKKLLKKMEELVTCLDFDDICAHNNWAERLLRGNVIMRKITFGNRSMNGIRNHEVLMSLAETARHNNLDPLRFLHLLLTNPTAASSALFSASPSSR